jgi:hypothetical protein
MRSGSRISRAAAVILGMLSLLGGARRAGAELRFAAARVDLGEVRNGAKLGHTFKFVNTGPALVEIVEVRPGCGCLKPRLERTSYRPGEEGAVLLEVNARGESAGPPVWRLRLVYREGGEACEAGLEVAARVITEVTLQPAALTLIADGPVTQEVLLTDLRPNPLTLRGLTTSAPCLRARAAERARDGLGHWIYKIRLEYSGDCPDGRHEEALTLYTDDPQYGELRLPITLTRRPRSRLEIPPGRVGITLAPGQAARERWVRLADREGGKVVVERVTADDPALVCAAAPGPDNGASVKIRLERDRLRGDFLESAVRVQLSSPVRDTVVIPVTCVAEP